MRGCHIAAGVQRMPDEFKTPQPAPGSSRRSPRLALDTIAMARGCGGYAMLLTVLWIGGVVFVGWVGMCALVMGMRMSLQSSTRNKRPKFQGMVLDVQG
jgi:hypothetical protein